LVSTPPTENGCPALNTIKAAASNTKLGVKWLAYLSTNGVYGNHDGAWVDETSELRATSVRATRRAAAENAWRAFADQFDLPLIIFRLPGIYGPGRSAIDSIREGKAKRIYKKGQVFSRMHVDDIASALAASMERPGAYDLYNLADNEPAPPQDVVEYACQLLGVEPPPLVSIEDANLSDMAKSFYADSKRVSNKRMKETLGVTLQYPSYREGLKAILAAEG
jgi:nucleoside-diphosphate-sugar epimerase